MKVIEFSCLIGVVIYKHKISESSTIRSLILISEFLITNNFKVIIWDNSPDEQCRNESELLKTFNNYQYIHTPENLSLAKIYNNIYQKNKEYNILILLDQDSEIEKEYFHKLNVAQITNVEIDLFLPIIKVESLIYSPANRFLVTGRHWKKERFGVIESSNKLAITSGMAIRMNYLIKKDPCFNEALNLYGIDTDFMIQYEKTNKYFFVLNYTMKHNLSLFEDESIEKKYYRFRNHINSLIHIYKKESLFKLFLVRIVEIKNVIKFSVKYKSIKFLTRYLLKKPDITRK